jgi:cell division protein FtsB
LNNMIMRERLFYGLLLVAGALMMGWALLSPDGLKNVWHLEEDRNKLIEEVIQLEEKKELIRHETTGLQSDVKVIERRARKDLGMVREDETLIMLKSKKKNAK